MKCPTRLHNTSRKISRCIFHTSQFVDSGAEATSSSPPSGLVYILPCKWVWSPWLAWTITLDSTLALVNTVALACPAVQPVLVLFGSSATATHTVKETLPWTWLHRLFPCFGSRQDLEDVTEEKTVVAPFRRA